MPKVRKNIVISKDAAAILDEQNNQSQYVEDLILGKGQPVPWATIEYKLEEISNTLNGKPNGRSKSDIMSEIDKLEAERTERLEYVQDSHEANILNKEYQDDINGLWREFNGLT